MLTHADESVVTALCQKLFDERIWISIMLRKCKLQRKIIFLHD